MQTIVKDLWVPEQVNFKSSLGKLVRDVLRYVPDSEQRRELLNRLSACVVLESNLSLCVHYANGNIWDLGSVGWKVVTTAGVNFIVDAFQNLVEIENLKFHALGTGSTAEAITDTALVTELTTEYTGNVRATGSLTEGATANIYRTVGTNTLDGTPASALREHGILDQAATGGGTLLDRTVFAAITLSSGDALQSTYDMTVNAGG